MKLNNKIKKAQKVFRNCCNLQKGESVLIITDAGQPNALTSALLNAIKTIGGVPTLQRIIPVAPGGELPEQVNQAAQKSDVIITQTSTSIFHSAGIRAVKKARVLALSEWDLDTLTGGGMEADFAAIEPIAKKVCKYFSQGNNLLISTPGGTQLSASIKDRMGYANTGIVTQPGERMGLPTIEVYIAPVEESIHGQIVVDASCSGGIGLINEPITINVKAGLAVSIAGKDEASLLKKLIAKANTPKATQIAEIAVGLNPCCRVCGKINEDEGRYGTCHMALGSNTGFGGFNDAPLHIDMVQWHPTLVIDGTMLFKDGVLIV